MSISESKVVLILTYSCILCSSYLACIIPCIFWDFVNGVIYLHRYKSIYRFPYCLHVCTNFPFSVFSLLYITLYRKWKYVDTREYRWGKNIHSVGLEYSIVKISSQKIVAKSWQPKNFSPECILLWNLKLSVLEGRHTR